MKKILVSACLLGDACRYDGRSVPNEAIQKILDIADLVPFCPEVEGGLPTPRSPSEIKKGNVYNQEGKNVTSFYEEGARKALELCKYLGIEIAILKDRSPACGSLTIHAGYFDGRLIKGEGWTTSLLRKNGIQVFSEEEIDKVVALLQHEDDERAKQKEESRIRREQKQAEKESGESEQLKEEKAKLEEELSAKADFSHSKRRFPPRTDKNHSFGRKGFGSRRPSYRRKEDSEGNPIEEKPNSEQPIQEGGERRNFHRSSRPYSPRGNRRNFSSRPRRNFNNKEGEGTSPNGEEKPRSFRPRRSSSFRGKPGERRFGKTSSFHGKRSFSKGGSSYPRRNSRKGGDESK